MTMVTKRESVSSIWLSPSNRSGKTFHDARLAKAIISLIKSTGITDSAPAIMPSPNLCAQKGELSRYENIYPHTSMGREVMIIMGMRDSRSMGKLFYFRKISYFQNFMLSRFPFLKTVEKRNIFAPIRIRNVPIIYAISAGAAMISIQKSTKIIPTRFINGFLDIDHFHFTAKM